MSSSLVIHPEDLEQFARDLDRFNSDLNSAMSMLRGRLSTLGQTWRDPAFDKFSNDMNQGIRTLNQYSQASSEFTSYLRRKAEASRNARDMPS